MENKIYFLGEILMRLQTEKDKSIDKFDAFLGGAEFNAAVNLSGLGVKTSFISVIPDSFLGSNILDTCNQYNIETKNIKQVNGEQGVYFVKKGKHVNDINVAYNRSSSTFNKSFTSLDQVSFEGGEWLHVSGISLSLSQETCDHAIKLIKKAKEAGLKISFDFNYREKLISYENAQNRYQQVLELSDLIFATKRDFVGIFNYDSSLEEQKILNNVQKQYNIQYIAHTTRGIDGFNPTLKGNLYCNDKIFDTEPESFQMIERIGAGDAFVAGILYGIVKNNDPQYIISGATHVSIAKQGLKGDFMFESVDDIKNIDLTRQKTISR